MTLKAYIPTGIAALTLLVLALLIGAGSAQASEVTGTLSSGATADTISGTVVAPAQCQDGIDNDSDGDVDYPADQDCESATDDQEEQESSGGGGGGSRRSSSNNNNDDGEVLGTQTDGMGGGGDDFIPGVPNTGQGGGALYTVLTLLASLSMLGAGAGTLRYRYK